ncbi:ParB N-terminal domain-containing protein (plasmid) [Streptomyces sp. NBC_00513]|uniref:ParB/RepB/Spo0J family partition protein n=1 Tax=unclassified Streptomyces TaxID=2593676 RepID=UPI002253E4F3|nr:ParB N-terminal domain-containing protein [Streptomyces sp. NBC_00424]MCX5079181.1 ParB N-terminal domain-containing protein [Streptomyces sp. NBC_00424]WUD46367.1 ParB N-terminal domain-containing protein [Streptomyces sp. NBC_00513]
MSVGRRTSLASLAGQKVDDVPGRSDPLLLTLPLSKMVPSRFNPRRNFGTEDDLREFGLKLKKRQLQPAVVVSRAAYLKLWPEEEDSVGALPYVIANGERRFRASLAVGLSTLNVVHNEDVAKSRADFLDAVLAENNDREDLDPIERAIGIETMVEQLGGADRVAEHYEKTKGWVSQQRKLLKLVPELQSLVSQGEMPVRVARDIAGLPRTDQVEAWALEVQRRAAAERAPRAPRARKTDAAPAAPVAPVAVADPGGFTAVNRNPVGAHHADASATTVDAEQPRFTAVNQLLSPTDRPSGIGSATIRTESLASDGRQAPPELPDPRSELRAITEVPKRPLMPWADGVASMDIIFEKLQPEERRRAIARYLELLGSAEAFVVDLSASSSPAFRSQVAELLLKEL